MDNLDEIITEASNLMNSIEDAVELENAKARYLGKSGILTDLLKGLGKLPAEQRPMMGSLINEAKNRLKRYLN